MEELPNFAFDFFTAIRKDPSEVPMFLFDFYKDNQGDMADLCQESQTNKELNPFSLEVSYKGRTLGKLAFGKFPFTSDPIKDLEFAVSVFGRNFLPNLGIFDILSENQERRQSAKNMLFSLLDINNRRNWVIVWAYMDRIKTIAPEVYEVMTKGGEFLTVEELEQKVKESKEAFVTSE